MQQLNFFDEETQKAAFLADLKKRRESRLLPNLTDHDLIEAEREYCRRSLANFAKRAWHVLEPATPLAWGWCLDAICEHLEAVSHGKINRLLMTVPPGSMKALAFDTPVLTIDGWKKHGELSVGDFVFSPDGFPVKVIARTENIIEPIYEIEFNCGAKLQAGAAHLWEIEREYMDSFSKWRRVRRQEIVNTLELKHGERSDRIALCKPIKQPYRELLIEPYLLGAWLGDGASGAGVLYVSAQDIEHFAKLGVVKLSRKADFERGTQDFYKVTVSELATKTRILGLQKNKHIPSNYLQADFDSRIALLQGLMDTDGHCDKKGLCSFSNKNQKIVDGFCELVCSLGLKPYRREKITKLNGISYLSEIVSFSSNGTFDIFRLQRKQKRVSKSNNVRTFSRYIKSVKEKGLGFVNCIQVEGGLYLAGKEFIKTHNSLLTSVLYPAFEWGPLNKQEMRFLSTSHKQDLAVRDNMKCRRLIQSEWFQKLFPVKLTGDQNSKLKFENNKTGFREASAFTSMTGVRGDRVIIDDPLSADDANSEAALNAAETTFLEALPTRVNNDQSAIIVIMQRLHERDTAGIILSKDLGYTHLCLPMRFEASRRCKTNIGFVDPRKKDGELLFPQRFPIRTVEQLEKTLGSYATAGQLQQRPTPRGGGIFKDQWWRYYKALPKITYRMIYADTAQKTKTQNDYTVFQCWGYCAEQKSAYLIDQVRGKWEAPELLIAAKAFWNKHKIATGVGVLRKMKVEDKTSGTGLIQQLQRDKIAVEGIKRDTDKVTRAYDAAPYAEAGQCYLPAEAPFLSDLLHELTSFPSGAHDDQVDPLMDALSDMLGGKVSSFDWNVLK